jgi:hypothetical protein
MSDSDINHIPSKNKSEVNKMEKKTDRRTFLGISAASVGLGAAGLAGIVSETGCSPATSEIQPAPYHETGSRVARLTRQNPKLDYGQLMEQAESYLQQSALLVKEAKNYRDPNHSEACEYTLEALALLNIVATRGDNLAPAARQAAETAYLDPVLQFASPGTKLLIGDRYSLLVRDNRGGESTGDGYSRREAYLTIMDETKPYSNPADNTVLPDKPIVQEGWFDLKKANYSLLGSDNNKTVPLLPPKKAIK